MVPVYKALYTVVILIRILSVLVIFRWPLLGWLVIFITDTSDYFFALRAGFTYAKYEFIDKSLDILNRAYFVVPAFTFFWPDRYVFLFLFFYRLIGDVLYFRSGKEKHFFFFPNILEFLLPAYIIFNHNLLLSLAISVPLKLVHEYGLHLKNYVDPVSRAYILKHPEHNRESVNNKAEPGRQ